MRWVISTTSVVIAIGHSMCLCKSTFIALCDVNFVQLLDEVVSDSHLSQLEMMPSTDIRPIVVDRIARSDNSGAGNASVLHVPSVLFRVPMMLFN